MAPALGRAQQHTHGDVEVDKIVFQKSGGMLDAELILQ